MNVKRLALAGLLTGLALLATGCELARWLRLLSFKKQLAQLERYVRVEEKDGLTLRFVKPVVYTEDLSMLIDDETQRITNRNHVTWLFDYENQSVQPKSQPGQFDLSCALEFEHSKFAAMRFPDGFLTLMPKPIILGLLRSLGQAKVDVKHGNVDAKWVGPGPGQKVELPTRSQVKALLGEPFIITESNRERTVLYKFYQKTPTHESPADRLAWATFTFQGEGEEIMASEGVIGNIGWTLTRVAGEPEPRVTFSFRALTVEPVAINVPSEIADGFVGQYKGPEGAILSVGHDRDVFVGSYIKSSSNGWWSAALPERTNVLFSLPSGEPNCTFFRDNEGVVTGLLAHLNGEDRSFTKFAKQLPPTPPEMKVEPRVYAGCAGRYKASWGGTVTISRQGEQLYWHNQGIQVGLPIYPSSETNFFFKAVDSPLTFVKNGQGEVTKFVLHYNGHDAAADKIK